MKRSVAILSILALLLVVAAPVEAMQLNRMRLVWPPESPPEVGSLASCGGNHFVNMRWVGLRDITMHWPNPYIDAAHPHFVVYQTNVVITVHRADLVEDPVGTFTFVPRNSNTLSSKLNVRGEQHFPDPANNLVSEWVIMEGSGLNVMVPGYGKVHIAGRLFISSTGEPMRSGNPLPLGAEDTQALCDCLG
jgi:hypothetical protein